MQQIYLSPYNVRGNMPGTEQSGSEQNKHSLWPHKAYTSGTKQ